MASGVNVKMGVSGVAQFKAGMKESQAAVKSLDAALKLNEAQLKLNGNEEQVLQNKTALLSRQIEEQKNVVNQAAGALEAMTKNGVSKTSTAFQNMQTQLYKAQTDLVKMQTEMDGVGDAGEEAQSGVSHMNQALQRIGTNVSFDAVVNGIEKVTNGLEAAGKKALQLGKKLVQAMLQGGQWADELQTTADQWEMTPEQVYRMQQTANVIDTSAETIFSARQKLITAMGKESDKETMGAFAALGINYLAGTDDNIERVFWKAGEALMQMDDKVARNEYAMKLYGKSWTDLIPIFKTGREEYEKTMKSWDWVGDQNFNALTQLDDESNKTKSAWENIQHALEAAMAPSMVEIMQSLQGMMSSFNEYLQSDAGQEMLTKLNEAVSGLFTSLTDFDPEEVVAKVVEIFGKIQEGLQWIIDNKDKVASALKIIAGGFGLLKLTSLASNIGRIVTGLGGLFGGGNGTGTGSMPNQMDQTDAGRPGGDVGKITQGGGWLVGAMNAVTGAVSKGAAFLTSTGLSQVLPILPMVLEDFTTFGRTLRDGGTLLEASVNSWNTMKASATQGIGNFTNYFTKDIPDAAWGLLGVKDAADLEWKLGNAPEDAQRALFGSGEQHQYQLTEQDLARAALKLAVTQEEFVQPTDRMTQVAGEMSGEVTLSRGANQNMTEAAHELMGMPAEMYKTVYNAIVSGMSSVTIVVDAGCVDTIGQRISHGFANSLSAEIP